METKKTTINLDAELIKQLKLKALKSDMTLTDLLTLYLKNGLANHNKLKSGIVEKNYNRYVKIQNRKK